MAVDYTFQNVVNIEPAAGLPGGYAAVNPTTGAVSGGAGGYAAVNPTTGAVSGGAAGAMSGDIGGADDYIKALMKIRK